MICNRPFLTVIVVISIWMKPRAPLLELCKFGHLPRASVGISADAASTRLRVWECRSVIGYEMISGPTMSTQLRAVAVVRWLLGYRPRVQNVAVSANGRPALPVICACCRFFQVPFDSPCSVQRLGEHPDLFLRARCFKIIMKRPETDRR